MLSPDEKALLTFTLTFLWYAATHGEQSEGVSRTYVKEGEDAVLHCSSGESLVNTVIDWKNKDKDVFLYSFGKHYENGQSGQYEQYKGRASLFYDELKYGNASMILRDTRVEDTGNYTCVLPRLSSRVEKSTMELLVEPVFKNRFGLKEGAVQTPFLGISYVTEGGVELQCVVRGSSSKPSVEWQTCEGISLNAKGQTVSETRGRYDTMVLVTVTETETNCFRCVVTQEDIYHRIHDEFTVPGKLFEKKSSHDNPNPDIRDCDAGVLVGVWFSGVGVTLALLLVPFLIIRIIRRRGKKNGPPEKVVTYHTYSDDISEHKIENDTNDTKNGRVKTDEEDKMMKFMKFISSLSTSEENVKNQSIDGMKLSPTLEEVEMMMGMMQDFVSRCKTSEENVKNQSIDTNNMASGTMKEKVKLKNSGETRDDVRVAIPQTESQDDELLSDLQSSNGSQH